MISAARTLLRHGLTISICLPLSLILPLREKDAGWISLATSVLAQENAVTDANLVHTGTVTIEQESDGPTLGQWILVLPTHARTPGGGSAKTLSALPPGNYTLFVTPPNGAIASVRTYSGAALLAHVERPQASFTLGTGGTLRIGVHFAFVRTGTVSMHSDPPGVRYTLWGPNKLRQSGVTPDGLEDAPEGQYKVEFSSWEGCPVLPPMSDLLNPGKRVSFSVKVSCAAADAIRARLNVEAEAYLTIDVDGRKVTLRDVPRESWFASFVFTAARQNVLAGYSDAQGEPTGYFGPGNAVSVAELSKIAHRLAGLPPASASTLPRNRNARGKWFTPFIASAEERGWVIFLDGTIDPARAATRGEVLVTILQALDVPLQWPQGKSFTDVSHSTPYAAAIETAAAAEVVAGRTGAEGEPTGTFDPFDPVTRAEMAKIISRAIEVYRTTTRNK